MHHVNPSDFIIPQGAEGPIFYPFAPEPPLPFIYEISRAIARAAANGSMESALGIMEQWKKGHTDFVLKQQQKGDPDPRLWLNLELINHLHDVVRENRRFFSVMARDAEALDIIDESIIKVVIRNALENADTLSGAPLENHWLTVAGEMETKVRTFLEGRVNPKGRLGLMHPKRQFVQAAAISARTTAVFWMLQSSEVNPFSALPCMERLYSLLGMLYTQGKGDKADYTLGEASPVTEMAEKHKRRMVRAHSATIMEDLRRRLWP